MYILSSLYKVVHQYFTSYFACSIKVSRPQIHGYDLNCVAITSSSVHFGNAPSTPPGLLFIACDEKVIRVLDAPRGVILGVKKLCEVDILGSDTPTSTRVDRAYIPELGLSNKAADLMSSQEQAEYAARNVLNLSWASPPLEGQVKSFSLQFVTTMKVNLILFSASRSHALAGSKQTVRAYQ